MGIATVLIWGLNNFSEWLYVEFTNDEAGAEEVAFIATGVVSIVAIIGLLAFVSWKRKKFEKEADR